MDIMTIVSILFTLSLIGAIIFIIIKTIKRIIKISKKTENTTIDSEENTSDISLEFKESTTKKGEFLIFKTETTGLLSYKNIDPKDCDTNEEPYPIQLTWLLLDEEFKAVSRGNHILKQDCHIPAIASNIHGITTNKMKSKGIAPTKAYSDFISDLNQATDIIAHNLNFNSSIIKIDFIRNGLDINLFNNKKTFCTMEDTTDIVKMEDDKYPKINELFGFLFYNRTDISFDEQHDAMNDTIITAKCFEHLYKKHNI